MWMFTQFNSSYIFEIVISNFKNTYFIYLKNCKQSNKYTVKPIYTGHSREPEHVAFKSSCIQGKNICTIH
jgi:hypothetical protein